MWDAYVAVQDKKIYLAGGGSSNYDAYNPVYVYDVDSNQWAQLPLSGQYLGVLCIIGGKLTIIGGRLSVTGIPTNKVSTFDEFSHTWISYYPDLVSVRHRPGVVTHQEYVILASRSMNEGIVKDDIEILNWIENSHWRIVSVDLPEPMWNFTPTIANEHIIIVGFSGVRSNRSTNAYKIPVADITTAADQQQKYSAQPTKWIKMATVVSKFSALIPNSFPTMVVGGINESGTIPTSDIMIYEDSSQSWRKAAALSSARSEVAIATINNNAMIVFGGCTESGSATISRASCLSTVELGQVVISKPTLIQY